MATMADAVRKRTANQKASAEETSQSPVRNWIQKNFTNVYAEPAATPKVEIKETAPATNAMAAAVRRRTAGQTSVATAQPSVTQRAQEWITNRKSELQTQISSYESALEKLRGAPTVAARLQNELNRTGVSGTTSFNPLGGVTAKADVYGAAKAKQGGIEELERELANLRHDLQELEDPVKAELMAWGAIKEEDRRARRQQAISTASDATQNAGYLGTSFVGGLTDVMGGFYNAADAILPDRNAAGEKINTPRIAAFQKAKGQLEDTVADYGAEVSPAMQKYGGMIARGVGYTLPSTVLAMLPGVQALSASAGGNVLANPQFWFSAIPMYGNGYAEAKEQGATEQEAQWFAALNAFAGAAVEIGGGVQKIPTQKSGLLTWIRGALEEGGEEVLQGIIEQAAKGVTYEENKKIASWDDPDAIISGKRALQEFGSGTLIGGLLGGGQVLAGMAVEAATPAENYELSFAFGPSDQEAMQQDARRIIGILAEEFENIPAEPVFDARYNEQVTTYSRKSDYVFEIFKQQGEKAYNPILGEVELGKTGAVKTTMHGFGKNKMAAAAIIKDVIEKGAIVRSTENYNSTGVTRHVLAARGAIDGSPAYVGVVVKEYPNQALTPKFYLHEAFVIETKETGSPSMAAPQKSAITTGNPVSNTTVPQNAGGVNTHSMQSGDGYTQSAYISEDQFVDRMGETPSGAADGGATSLGEGGLRGVEDAAPYGADAGGVQIDEGAVLESAVRSQLQRQQVDVSHLRVTDRKGESHYDTDAAIDSIAAAIGEEEMLRRMYNATRMDRPKGSVTIDGRSVDATAYVDAYEQSLPDGPAALQEHIRGLEQQRAAAILQMEREGTLEEYTSGGLKLDLQLFAANRKWELLQLDPEEGGKKTRQFFEKRLRGTDANHHDELVELLAGRSETYNPISTQQQLDRANNRLRSDAKYRADLIKRIGRYNPRDLFNPVDVAASQLLINDALNEGNYEVAADLIAGLSRKGTELGRAVQAFSIMARLTPEGTLRMAQRTIKNEADYIIGEGASEGLDMLADDIADAIREAVRKGISGDEIADRIRNGRPRGDVDMIPYGAMQTQEGTAAGGDTETRQTGMKPFEGMEPYAEPTYADGVVQNTAPMTRSELVNALVDDLAAEERNYLSREDIAGIVERAVDESTNIPEQVKRYVLKKIRKNDGALANRIYEVYRKGDMNQVKLRRAMEQALELPTLSDADVATTVEMAQRVQDLQDDPIAQADAMDDMYDFLAAKMSVNGWDKLQAWRKFGMLANVKTHLRNIGSNFAYGGVRKMDDALSMVLERMFRVKPDQRGAYLGWSHTEHGQSILPALQKKADTAVLEMQKRGAKYETGSGQLKQRRKHFGTGKVGEKLNAANRWNSNMLEKEDIIFFRPAYIDALGQMMTAQGATEITDAMHEKAMQRALEATFRADNAISEVFSNLKRFQNDSKAGLRLFGHAMDVVVPFHKTPANIATQTVMHSPIGIVKGAFDLYNATKGKGSKDAATAINTMAKGITGSALLAIGVLLGHLGLFNTGFGKTEKERAADELAGLQENAFVFGDVSISFDWLQPAASPLIVGASIGKRLADEDMNLGAVFGAVMDGTDSLFEMTMLQSLYDILGGYDAGATATAASIAENVVSQSIPTLVGQAARAIDPVQRKTTADSEFMTIVNQVVAKIPGLTYILDPELDVWGDEVYRTGKPGAGTAALNAIQQFILPSNVKVGTGRGDRTSAEILRLYRSQGSKAVPGAVSRDDAKDGGMDHVEINRRLGQVNRQAVEDFINNQWPYAVQVDTGNGKTKKETKYYRNMTDEERVRVLSRIYTNTKKAVTDPTSDEAADPYFKELFGRLR